MHTAGKIIIGILFTLLSLIFVLLTTLRFEILNSSFVFGSFERNNVYEKLPAELAAGFPNDPNLGEEEKREYTKFANESSEEEVKEFIEGNFTAIVGFIDGKEDDLVLTVPLEGSNFIWKMSENPGAMGMKNLNGIGMIITLLWGGVLLILIGHFFLYSRLTKSKKLLSGNILLLVSGSIVLVISTVLRLGLLVIGKELIKGAEPSQKLLGILSYSLIPDVVTTWILIGGVFIAFWALLRWVPIFLTKKHPILKS